MKRDQFVPRRVFSLNPVLHQRFVERMRDMPVLTSQISMLKRGAVTLAGSAEKYMISNHFTVEVVVRRPSCQPYIIVASKYRRLKVNAL